MDELLRQTVLFQDLSDDEVQRLVAIATSRTLRSGEYLFLLGDAADRLYVVSKGQVDLCFPISLGGAMNDISVESATPGKICGWSSLVKPYRFTLSARVAEPSEVIAFTRTDLLQLFDDEPRIGYAFLTKISELVGVRLLRVQALWVRELQRRLEAEAEHSASGSREAP